MAIKVVLLNIFFMLVYKSAAKVKKLLIIVFIT